jgi:galactokinase
LQKNNHNNIYWFLGGKNMSKEVKSFGPGRVEFIGNHTDYNNGWIIAATLNVGIHGTGKTLDDKVIALPSVTDIPLDILKESPAEIRAKMDKAGNHYWIRYPLGVAKVLYDDGLLNLEKGFELKQRADDNFPIKAGLSASAATETVTYMTLKGLFPFEDTLKDAVLRCQRAEHGVPGGACGNMDQFSSFAGYVQLFDAKDVTGEKVMLPEGMKIGVLDTGVKHSIAPTGEEVSTAYSKRKEQCFEAAKHLGVGSLRDVSTNQLDSALNNGMDEMLYRRAYHVAGENERAKKMYGILSDRFMCKMFTENVQDLMFRLMVQSQISSAYMFENSCPELDHITRACHIHGLGSRLTGGGFGGAAVVPLLPGDEEKLPNVIKTYKLLMESGLKGKVEEPKVHIFETGPGAYK